MPREICLAVALAASACAAHRVPDRIISTDWATIQALPEGTEVTAALDGEEVRRGRIREVTSSTMTLWERHGPQVIPRARIAHVAERIASAPSRGRTFMRTTMAAAAIAGLFGAVVAAMGENGSTRDDGVEAFVIGTLAGAAYGAARQPTQRYDERLVYIRP
jgi:hypothetical protein